MKSKKNSNTKNDERIISKTRLLIWCNLSYIGSSMRQRGVLGEENREKLVGVFPKKRKETFEAGSIICKQSEVKVLV